MVHLVRHGEVHNPKHLVYADLPGFGLGERGRLQARAAGRYLASSPVVSVWSSPLERALETAHLIAARHRLHVRVDEGLTEWHLSGRWAGVKWEELPIRMPGELEAYLEHPWDLSFTPETLEALAERIAQVATRLDAAHPHGDIVIVGHQDPIHAARLHLTGADPRLQHTSKPDHAEVISLRSGTPWKEIATWRPEESGLAAD